MMHRWIWFLSVGLLLGCGGPGGGEGEEEGGEGEGEGEGECSDPDHDNFGVGDGCQGDDCDEGNPYRQEGCAADCGELPEDVGCPCDDNQPIPCFDANSELAGTGACQAGIKRCEGGVWTFCEGQVLPGEEICNEQDDNCDGETDENVTNACGTCGDENCRFDEIGGDDWDPDNQGNGVIVEDGNLTLSEYAQLVPYLWAASQTDSTVTLINTDTREQLARYLISPNEGVDQPMSISILPWAGAVIAVGDSVGEWSRGHRITRVSYGPCPDTDGDDQVRTSDSYDNMLEWGGDDCVLWSKDYDFNFRVVTWETRDQLDGRADFIWVGGTGDADWGGNQDPTVYELDDQGDPTGRTVALPMPPSGLVLDPDGMLWVAAEWSQTGLVRIDTDSLEFDFFETPQGEKLCSLATDVEGNIWYPNDLGSQVWVKATEEIVSIPDCFGTVAATDRVFWGGWCQHNVTRMSLIDDDTVGDREDFPLPGASEFPYPSVSVTEEVFVLDPGSNGVYLMDPETGELETIADNIPNPGTCGDPTGVTNHRSVGASGTSEHLFEVCEDQEQPTTFSHIVYEGDFPPGTHASFAVRIADDIAGLAQAPSVAIGTAPEDESPLALAPAFGGESPVGNVMSLRITLIPSESDVPALATVGLGYTCAIIFE